MHIQQQILDAIEGILAAGGTAAGTRVFVEPLDPLEADQLPALVLVESADGEAVGLDTISAIEERIFNVEIACVVADATDYGAQARDLGLEVEKLLAAWPMPTELSGIVKSIRYAGSRLERQGGGKLALAARVQAWRCTYFCEAHAPDVPK